MKPKYVLKNGQSLYAYCIENRIDYSTIFNRIKKFNMTPDQALKKNRRKIKVASALKQIAVQEGIDYNKLYKAYLNCKKSLLRRLFRW